MEIGRWATVSKRNLTKESPRPEARGSSLNIIHVHGFSSRGFLVSLTPSTYSRCRDHVDGQPHNPLADAWTARSWFSFPTEQYRLHLLETSEPTVTHTGNSLAANARNGQLELPHCQSGLL